MYHAIPQELRKSGSMIIISLFWLPNSVKLYKTPILNYKRLTDYFVNAYVLEINCLDFEQINWTTKIFFMLRCFRQQIQRSVFTYVYIIQFYIYIIYIILCLYLQLFDKFC